MKRTYKQIVGQKGEDLACNYLKERGFSILDRNYREKWGEIDIVATNKDILHFVEVKTVTRNVLRVTDHDYEPEDNIHTWKLERLYRTIQTYLLKKYGDSEPDWVLDALAVYLDGAGELIKIEILEDI